LATDDVKIAVVNATTGTSSGNRTIDAPTGFGTPKAIMLLMTRTTTFESSTAHANVSVGFADASNDVMIVPCAEDNQPTTDTWTGRHTSRCGWMTNIASHGTDFLVQVDSFGTDEVVLNFSAAPASDFKMCVVFFGGDDLQVKVGYSNTFTEDITTVGFEPTVVLLACTNREVTAASTDPATLGIGASDGSDQCGMHIVSASNKTAGDPRAMISGSYALLWDENDYCSVGSFDSNGFTITQSSGTKPDGAIYLALETGDHSVWVDAIESPTSHSTDWDVSSVGFKPQFLLLGMTALEALDDESLLGNGGTMAISVTDGTNEFCVNITEEDDEPDTNSRTVTADRLMYVMEDDGTSTLFEGDTAVFDSGGWTVAADDLDDCDGTTRYFMALAIEETEESASIIPQVMYHRRQMGA
jgi:hypothetical protein